jgi:hypothetical protein
MIFSVCPENAAVNIFYKALKFLLNWKHYAI